MKGGIWGKVKWRKEERLEEERRRKKLNERFTNINLPQSVCINTDDAKYRLL